MGGGLCSVIVNERLKMRKSLPSQLITDRIPSLVLRSSKIEFSKNLGGRAAAFISNSKINNIISTETQELINNFHFTFITFRENDKILGNQCLI